MKNDEGMSQPQKLNDENGFSRRNFLQSGSAATLMTMLGSVSATAEVQPSEELVAGAPKEEEASKNVESYGDFPRVWISSPDAALTVDSFQDLVNHGVQVIETLDIENARKYGLRVMLSCDAGGMFMGKPIGARDALEVGLTPEYAVAIAGTYNNLSIDSHTFPFSKGKHTVEIGLPHHYAPYDWKTKKYFTDNHTFDSYFDERIFSTSRAFKAEVIVKQKDYDGQQHLSILPAIISDRGKLSLHITFDLTNVEGGLDQTMLAVYWRTNQLSPAAASTRETAVQTVRATLDRFTRENSGVFPDDVICALRYGDECFLRTGFANSPKCAIPLYDYSDSGIAGFRKLNREEHPRAWGFPEFFGVNAYRDWLYAFHCGTAELVKSVVSEAHKISPSITVFRNPTRFNPTPFATLANDHDGCSTQLLAQQFDMINADPYAVCRTGDSQSTNSDRDPRPGYISSIIPLEDSYWSGLVRRFGKKLVPWVQAHTFSHDLQHPSPNDVERIYEQTMACDPDGMMWLGYQPGETAESPNYGMTLPDTRPETWKALRSINFRAQRELGRPKKIPQVAVLRFYAERSLVDVERRHLHDRFLTEQILTGLAIDLDLSFDVFEYHKREDLDCSELADYKHIIMCVADMEGLPLDELKRGKFLLAIICWNAASLTEQSKFSGITRLRRLPGEAVGVTGPTYAGIVVPNNYSGTTDWKSSLNVTGPAGIVMPAGMAHVATLLPEATSIAKVGDECCAWRHRNAIFSSFLPSDPFDAGEYVRWLLNGELAR
jgi:hypothetical protein